MKLHAFEEIEVDNITKTKKDTAQIQKPGVEVVVKMIALVLELVVELRWRRIW